MAAIPSDTNICNGWGDVWIQWRAIIDSDNRYSLLFFVNRVFLAAVKSRAKRTSAHNFRRVKVTAFTAATRDLRHINLKFILSLLLEVGIYKHAPYACSLKLEKPWSWISTLSGNNVQRLNWIVLLRATDLDKITAKSGYSMGLTSLGILQPSILGR